MTTRTGQCLCGAITMSARTDAKEVEACHCRMCQRWTGSALIALEVGADALQIEGAESLAIYSSSSWAERGFCRTCGSCLFYRVTAPGDHQGKHYVPVGVFDDVEGLRLAGEIFHDRRLGVFEYAGETRKKTEAEVMAEFGGG